MTDSKAATRAAYIGIGSNLGGPARQLAAALDQLDAVAGSDIEGVSGL